MTYVNYGSITAVAVLLPTLGLIVLALRCYGRYRFCDTTGIDDVLVIPAVVLSTALAVSLIVGAQLKFIGGNNNQPFSEFRNSTSLQVVRMYKLQYGFWIGYDTAMSFTKLTFLFFFRRIFRGRLYRTAFDWTNWTLIILNILWMLIFDSLRVFRCGTDISRNWSSYDEQTEHCISPFTLMFASSVPNWIMDLAIFIEPLVLTLTLHMKRRRKIQASVIFFLSLIAVLAGLCRMVISIQAFHQQFEKPGTFRMLGITLRTHDITAIFSLAFFWTYMELGIGIIVVCLLSCGRVLEEICFRPARASLRRLSSRGSSSKQSDAASTPPNGNSGILQPVKSAEDQFPLI